MILNFESLFSSCADYSPATIVISVSISWARGHGIEISRGTFKCLKL